VDILVVALVVMFMVVMIVMLSLPLVMVLVIFGLRKILRGAQTDGVCCYR